jgi:hypothetical protein
MGNIPSPIPPLALLLLFGAKKNSENQTLFYAICARFFLFISFVVFRNDDRGSEEKGPKRDSSQQKFDFGLFSVSVPSFSFI